MIPQSVKDIVANGSNVGLYQTIAMLLFIIFFLGIVWYVFSRPKKFYEEQENAPLNDDIEDTDL
ncbi:CcoQ/FixQ family Cbb3-type cytochrome c oxidase assembly chaperone [Chryseobacterium sp. SNU WT5]|uniref:cbb3-type cytochrome oxidase subunit 3 n=1 Tax=Chryseobacterium sp. SNU WT5 TaxID=2594269 RepID=UPI00117CF835|nr:CcoQ/FixQ family Cbb3-type cytochrome c oxidase assembly chaperone [Chryseobacterium sp. SNU WT5]QDP85069.1 CcoQ/FixQ family Cbb3-type cytochrome c oxidase assembly chaperone [Chryseobacterium sp. SNU WT5]